MHFCQKQMAANLFLHRFHSKAKNTLSRWTCQNLRLEPGMRPQEEEGCRVLMLLEATMNDHFQTSLSEYNRVLHAQNISANHVSVPIGSPLLPDLMYTL
jgi:hypothetical protein